MGGGSESRAPSDLPRGVPRRDTPHPTEAPPRCPTHGRHRTAFRSHGAVRRFPGARRGLLVALRYPPEVSNTAGTPSTVHPIAIGVSK